MMFCDDVYGLVIDIGHLKSTIGFIGDETPSYYSYSKYAINNNNEKVYMNDLFNENNLSYHNLLENETYQDFDLLLDYSDKLAGKINSKLSETPVLFSDQNSINQREKLAELFFEKGNISNFFLVKKSSLTCFANGKTTGIVVESGANFNQICPVIDGYILQKSIFKNEFAGNYVDNIFKKYLTKLNNNPIDNPYQSFDKTMDENNNLIYRLNSKYNENQKTFYLNNSIRDLKEYFCKQVNNSHLLNSKVVEMDLPDGNKIEASIDFDMISSIFDVNYKYNIQNIFNLSLENCEVDYRKDLLSNIIIAGGNSLTSEFVENFEKKINDITPSNSKIKIIAYPKSMERRFSSWIGGSILSSTAAFQSLWISKFEYEEYGSSIVLKKLV